MKKTLKTVISSLMAISLLFGVFYLIPSINPQTAQADENSYDNASVEDEDGLCPSEPGVTDVNIQLEDGSRLVALWANDRKFYPAFDNAEHKLPEGVRFYRDSEFKEDITDSAISMSALAESLRAGADGKLPLLFARIPEGKTLRCFTTVDTTWNDAFGYKSKHPDKIGFAYEYDKKFKQTNCINGVEGIHFEDSGDSEDIFSWMGFSGPDSVKPTLNRVSYTNFYKAYKSGLSSKCSHPWSRIYFTDKKGWPWTIYTYYFALAFDAPKDKWGTGGSITSWSFRTTKESVVLTKVF